MKYAVYILILDIKCTKYIYLLLNNLYNVRHYFMIQTEA